MAEVCMICDKPRTDEVHEWRPASSRNHPFELSEWINGRCALDGGLGVAYEERPAGSATVCENGHHWIAYRRAREEAGG